MKIAIALGTRPEIIKMAPIIRECIKRNLDFFIVHSGQHYSFNLDKIFFKELELPEPKYNINAGSGTHAEETAKILVGMESIFLKEKPDVVLVQGDTNTTLSAALAAVKLHIKIGHVEAGLRSGNRFMPEEINRIIVDHISDYLFAPTKESRENLIKEGIPNEKIFVTGNTIVDSVFQNLKIASKYDTLRKLSLESKRYILVTLHRAENVDDKEKLESILKALEIIKKDLNMDIVFPIHPRTKKRIKEFNIDIEKFGFKIMEPVGFLDFLNLEKNAKLIITDSGGIQEEACILKVPCVTVREETERPETVEVGANKLSGTNTTSVVSTVKTMLESTTNWEIPFGNGSSGIKIVNLIMQ